MCLYSTIFYAAGGVVTLRVVGLWLAGSGRGGLGGCLILGGDLEKKKKSCYHNIIIIHIITVTTFNSKFHLLHLKFLEGEKQSGRNSILAGVPVSMYDAVSGWTR